MKTIAALLTALCLTAGVTSVRADPLSGGGLGPELCGPDQLSGQYECVTSAPLSEDEVCVSMAYLAAPKPRQMVGEQAFTKVSADAVTQQRTSHD